MQWITPYAVGGLIVIAVLLIWFLVIRPVLVNAPILGSAFKAEASFADKARVKLLGWKTKIAARLLGISGILVGLYDSALPYLTGQDWTPVTAKIPSWTLPVGMFALAWLFSYLRKATENPPTIVTQKVEDGAAAAANVAPGTPVVVDLIKAPPAVAPAPAG